MKQKRNWWENFVRLLNMRLVVPLKRSPHPPEYTARGVLVGMMWAMTPLVGIQMTTVLLTWLAAKKIFKWSFSLPIAIAYTWVTNVFTMGPVYYVFYVTGKAMMGDFQNISAFASFSKIMHEAFSGVGSFWEIGKALVIFGKVLLQEWGVAMALGCLPWSLFCGWLSYRLTMKWLLKRQAKKNKSAERRQYWRERLAKVVHPSPYHKKKKGKKHARQSAFGKNSVHRPRFFKQK